MAELIGEALGKQPRITLAAPLLGEVTHYVANIGKAQELLGYAPRVPLEEGIPRAVAWSQEWEPRHESAAAGVTPAPGTPLPERSHSYDPGMPSKHSLDA
jgi:hypothetical protein